jgi:hypothetical protein
MFPNLLPQRRVVIVKINKGLGGKRRSYWLIQFAECLYQIVSFVVTN